MPSVEQRLSALEMFAKGGAYVPPTDTPTPPPPTPTPTPLPDPTPGPGDRQQVQPGFNFSGKTGKFLAAPGEYPVFKAASGLDVLCPASGGMVFVVGSGKQFGHNDAQNVTLDGFKVDGKGKGGAGTKLNDKAMFLPGDRWTLRNFVITGAQGVGCGCDGSGIRMTNGLAHDNGSAGIGGKAKGAIFRNIACSNNNAKVKDRDGATFGKFTRCEGQLFIDCLATGGTCAGIWHDINNCNIVYIRATADGVRLAANDRPWTGAGFKEEISESKNKAFDTILALCREAGVLRDSVGLDGVTEEELRERNYIYKDCTAVNTASYCVDWNETRDTLWDGGVVGDAPGDSDGGSFGLRDLPRDDAKEKGQENNWVLGNNLVRGAKAATGRLRMVGSNAGKKLSRSKYNIGVQDVAGTVEWVRISA